MTAAELTQRDFAPPVALLQRWRGRALAVGIAGAILTILGAFTSPDELLRGYLMGFLVCLSFTLGSMAWLMLGHLTGGNWWMLGRRVFEAAVKTLPLVTAMFIPILLGMHRLYLWTHPDDVAGDKTLMAKAFYLNTPTWILRAAIYFVLWNVLGYLLTRWSAEQDVDESPAVWRRLKKIAAPGLALYAFSLNFAATDWVMSLDPHWFSTIYGLLFVAQHLLATMALLICLLVLLAQFSPMNEVLRPDRLHDCGKLMLALTMVWAYFSFSQWLIIWMGNLPEEISWYLMRIKHGWQIVALMLVILQFALPFALLLSRDLKRDTRKLVPVALLVLFMRFVDAYWLVAPNPMPGPRHEHIYLHWTYLAAPIALVGLWFAFFAWNLAKRPLLVRNEPQLARLWESSHAH
jgi:hypothetical protein